MAISVANREKIFRQFLSWQNAKNQTAIVTKDEIQNAITEVDTFLTSVEGAFYSTITANLSDDDKKELVSIVVQKRD